MVSAIGLHADSRGYLPKLGPAALRFQRPVELQTVRWMLPPLRMDDLPEIDRTNAAIASTNAPANGTNPAVARADGSTNTAPANTEPLGPHIPPELAALMAMINGASAGTNITQPAMPPPPPPVVVDHGPVITPQMLVQFFKPAQGTNTTTSVLVPGGFLPPQPPPPSSSATYKSQ